MRKAFTTKFLEQTTNNEENHTVGLAGNFNALTALADRDDIDNAEIWNDLQAEDATEVEKLLNSHPHLQDYAHTRQL